MGRPKLIETDAILEAARGIFLEEGVGATTGAIARRAGISEATIFKRFPTKAELFFAAMGFDEFDLRQAIEDLRGKGPASRAIAAISLRLLGYLGEMVPVLIRLLAHPGVNAARLAEKVPEMPVRALVEAVAEYVESERRGGRVGPCDPYAVAATIFGILHNRALLEHIGIYPKDERSREKFVRTFIEVLWNGIRPEEMRGVHADA